MKLHRLIIENFRIFHGKYEFDFSDKKFVIISGQNGHGKSSIFDAIEWCITGEIQRYKGDNEYQYFNYLINDQANLNESTTMNVQVWLMSEHSGSVQKISRVLKKTITSKGEIKVTPEVLINDGKKKYGKTAGATRIRELLFKKGVEENTGDKKQKAFNLSDFFSSTQILSQDQIQAFIHDNKPQDRFRLMESVLGLNKYGSHFREYVSDIASQLGQDRKTLEQASGELQKELDIKNAALQLEKNTLREVGELPEVELTERVNSFVAQVKSEISDLSPLTQLNEVFRDEFAKKRPSLGRQRDRYNLQIELLDNFKECLNTSFENYHVEKNDLEELSAGVSQIKDRRTKGQEKARTCLNVLRSVKDRRNIFKLHTDSLVEIQSEIQKLEVEERGMLQNPLIEAVGEQYNSLGDFLNGYQEREKQQIALEMFVRFVEQQEGKKRLAHEIAEIDQKAVSREKQRLVLVEEMNKVLEEITSVSSVAREEQNDSVDQLVRDIQNYILREGEPHQPCPVCGTDFESPQSIQTRINDLWEKAKKKRSETDQKIVELTTIQNELSRKQDEAKKEIAAYRREKKKKKKQLDDYSLEVEKIRSSLTDDILDLSLDEVHQRMVVNAEFLEGKRLTFQLVESVLETINRKQELIKQATTEQKSIEELKRVSGRKSIYLDGDESLIKKKDAYLERYLSKSAEQLLEIEQLMKGYKNRLRALTKKWEQREQKLKDIRKEIPEFNGEAIELENLVLTLRDKVSQLAQWDREMEVLLLQMKLFLDRDKMVQLREEEQTLQLQMSQTREKIREFSQLESELNALKKKHELTQSELMASILLNYSEVIDRLFMQISPHAIFRHVQLIPRRGSLYIVMDDQEATEENVLQISDEELFQKFNASLTFSSGQANILAVCIFLALNLSQQWTNLKLLGIDDPFQNLDDINAFSFIDVLSQICTHKQILISTHNEDFVALIRAKMAMSEGDIGSIALKSYTREKLVVESDCLVFEG